VRGQLSRGVRANTSLTELDVGHTAGAALQALVAARRAAQRKAAAAKQAAGSNKKAKKGTR
jgi:hypothetical protein